MKTISLSIIFAVSSFSTEAQPAISDFFKTAPALKTATYTRRDNQYQFSTAGWYNITNKDLWPYLFGIENDKTWTGQNVSGVRLAGCWKIGVAVTGYLYAADLETEQGVFTTSIFLSSFDTESSRKGIDVDPFSQAPSPTGMKGKIIVTQTLKTSPAGIFIITGKYQSAAKLLSKTIKYRIAADGRVEVL